MSAEAHAPSTDPSQLRKEAFSWLLGAFDALDALAEVAPSRSLSLAITKVEESILWFEMVGDDGAESNPLRGGN